jgi:hypothetical protein
MNANWLENDSLYCASGTRAATRALHSQAANGRRYAGSSNRLPAIYPYTEFVKPGGLIVTLPTSMPYIAELQITWTRSSKAMHPARCRHSKPIALRWSST